MPVRKLETIDADTLLGIPYEPPAFLVEGLLPQGLHLLAGAPKIGKSWLALWLCLRVAQGQPLWNFATCPCEVLYLCLEDSFQRIQSRLFDLTEEAPPALHFAVMAEQLRSGLVEQIGQFLREHPATGLSGATDSNFVLRKSKRRENTATLYCTGRDIPYRELSRSSTVRPTSGTCSPTTVPRWISPAGGFPFFSLPCCESSQKSAPLPRCCWRRSTLAASKG